MKKLEDDNRRLKHMVVGLSLDKEALKAVIRKNGRFYRAGFTRMITDGDHVSRVFGPGKFIDRFGMIFRDIDADLAHGCNRVRSDVAPFNHFTAHSPQNAVRYLFPDGD